MCSVSQNQIHLLTYLTFSIERLSMKFITFTTNKAGYKNKKKMAAYWSNNTAMLSLSGSYISFGVWLSSCPHFENDHSIVILSSFYIIHYYINSGFLLLSSGRLELCPFPSQDHWRLLFINLLFLICLFLSALPVNCLLTTKRDETRASRISLYATSLFIFRHFSQSTCCTLMLLYIYTLAFV